MKTILIVGVVAIVLSMMLCIYSCLKAASDDDDRRGYP